MRKTVKNLTDSFQIEPMYKFNCKKHFHTLIKLRGSFRNTKRNCLCIAHNFLLGENEGWKLEVADVVSRLIGPICTANPFGRRTLHWNFVQFSFSAFVVPHLPVSSFLWPDFLKTYPVRTLARKRLKKQQICGNFPIGTILNCNCWGEWSMAINKCNNFGVESNFWRDRDKEKDKKKDRPYIQ